MPYQRNTDLPKGVKRHLPKHAQDIYRAAFNNAEQEYQEARKRRAGHDPEETAARVAWSAVKNDYKKGEDGNWHRK